VGARAARGRHADRVAEGEGQFAGARRLIASILLVGEDRAITDHHIGVLFLP
jgi:hypothetical protein